MKMAGKLGWMIMGVWGGLGFCANALAQDAPIKPAPEIQPQVADTPVSETATPNPAMAVDAGDEKVPEKLDVSENPDSLKVIDNPGAETGADTKSPKPATVAATESQPAKQLPVTDIELPKAPVADAATKKSLSQKVAAILNEKAIRGTTIGIRVVDLDSGDVVYARNDSAWLKPASNTKLVTTAAALSLLGADSQFESFLTSKGKIENGVLQGNLQLYIDHDFTWSTRFYESGDVPLRGMIQQLKSAGITKIKGKVIVSGYVVYGGEATDTLDTNSHLTRVGTAFGRLLNQNKISHNGIEVRQTAKKEGSTLASWKSPVLSEAIVPLNRSSHNLYADMLLLAIGSKIKGKSTYDAGAQAVRAWLEKNHLPLKGFNMVDGSGLSHDNRMSAEFFTALVSLILNHSAFAREWAASLSIAGYDGTYGGRLATDDAKGRVYAKSGTLRDTISSSGFFVNRMDGHTYAFSILCNGMRNRKLTRIALDRIVRVFLGSHLNAPKLATPEMTSFSKESDGRVMARWNAVGGTLGYRVYRSEDGNKWRVAAETKDLALVMPDEPAHLRITAVSAKGAESEPSLIFTYRPGEKIMTIVEQAKCRSDGELRPPNHFIAHERPLADFVDNNWGVETVRVPRNSAHSAALLYHSATCGTEIAWDAEKISSTIRPEIPVIVNVPDAHRASKPAECKPEDGKFLGCYADPIVTMDRRIGIRADNTRLRKAAGSASAKPSAVSVWPGSQTVLEMASSPVAVRKKNESGGATTIIGFDLQAVDSQKSRNAFWKKIME